MWTLILFVSGLKAFKRLKVCHIELKIDTNCEIRYNKIIQYKLKGF